MDLVEFLTARLAEDEAVARAAADRAGYASAETTADGNWSWLGGHIGCDNDSRSRTAADDLTEAYCPARVLREVAAKRRLLKAADESSGLRDMVAELYVGGVILRALAAVYSDHDDYRAEWAL